MGLTVEITAITGASPYQVYICQVDGSDCFYVATTSTIPYTFQIPPPYDTSFEYMVKIVDAFGRSISNTGSIIS